MVGMKGAFVIPGTAVEPPAQPSTRIVAQFKAYQDLLGRPGIAGADYSSKDYVDQNNPFIVGTLAFTRAAIAAMRARAAGKVSQEFTYNQLAKEVSGNISDNSSTADFVVTPSGGYVEVTSAAAGFFYSSGYFAPDPHSTTSIPDPIYGAPPIAWGPGFWYPDGRGNPNNAEQREIDQLKQWDGDPNQVEEKQKATDILDPEGVRGLVQSALTKAEQAQVKTDQLDPEGIGAQAGQVHNPALALSVVQGNRDPETAQLKADALDPEGMGVYAQPNNSNISAAKASDPPSSPSSVAIAPLTEPNKPNGPANTQTAQTQPAGSEQGHKGSPSDEPSRPGGSEGASSNGNNPQAF